MNLILRQPSNSAEARAVTYLAMTQDIEVRSVEITALAGYALQLRSGSCLPIGSVEYVREAMKIAGMVEPANCSYPACLQNLLYRELRQIQAGSVIGDWFVKPVTVKRFNGFIFSTMQDPATLDEHDREQYDLFMEIPPNEKVWISEPVKFISEWRYYVLGGKIIGSARYDPDGSDVAPEPSQHAVLDAIYRLECDPSFGLCAYALDMGVLSTGENALVEVNDAFALGLYSNSVDRMAYIEMLQARWAQMSGPANESQREQNHPQHDLLRG